VPEGDGLTGTVVMGALVSALMGAFADALWAIKRQHPRLEVSAVRRPVGRLCTQAWLRGELDAAVVTQPPCGCRGACAGPRSTASRWC
jgi:DNA-binding transcriptional LysR family regulator